MRLVSLRRQAPTINLSALVDVLFILIIFVMLAAEFDRTGAIEVTLPGATDPPAIAADPVRLVVPADGPLRLNRQTIADDELAAALTAARGGRTTLLLVADGEVPLARATALIEAGNRAGFTTVSIAARPQEPQ